MSAFAYPAFATGAPAAYLGGASYPVAGYPAGYTAASGFAGFPAAVSSFPAYSTVAAPAVYAPASPTYSYGASFGPSFASPAVPTFATSAVPAFATPAVSYPAGLISGFNGGYPAAYPAAYTSGAVFPQVGGFSSFGTSFGAAPFGAFGAVPAAGFSAFPGFADFSGFPQVGAEGFVGGAIPPLGSDTVVVPETATEQVVVQEERRLSDGSASDAEPVELAAVVDSLGTEASF